VELRPRQLVVAEDEDRRGFGLDRAPTANWHRGLVAEEEDAIADLAESLASMK